MEAIFVLFTFGIAAGVIGRLKGGSFLIWFLVGGLLPFIGLAAAILHRNERFEPERRCPRCGAVHKIHVQVCSRCGEDLYLPDPSEVRQPRMRT